MTTNVGVIGLGRMGRAIAARLLAQGFGVTVFNRTPGRAARLESLGAQVADSARDLGRRCPVVISTLTNKQAVLAMCSGPDGLVAGLGGGAHLSMSTLAPESAARFAELHLHGKCRYVSVPVQGRPAMAEVGQLVAWVSGPGFGAEEANVVNAVARRTNYLGEDVRHAAAAKLALNMLMNANIELFAEAFAYLDSRGVDTRVFGEGVTDAPFAAPIFKAIVAGLSRNDDTAQGSDVSVSRKDLGLLVQDARDCNLPVTLALEEVFASAEARGWGALEPTTVRRLFAAGRK